jgi:hypothetical protein
MLDIVFAPLAALFTLAERSRNRRRLTVCAHGQPVARFGGQHH